MKAERLAGWLDKRGAIVHGQPRFEGPPLVWIFAMKICPVCSKRYEDSVLFCPADGAGLVPMPSAETPVAGMPAAGNLPRKDASGGTRPVASNTGRQSTKKDPNDPMVGTFLFGEYEITKKLGEGGMGAVYLAENANIQQRIAVKVLHGEAAQSDELVKRFNREAQAISRLTHPNIIRVFIFGNTDDGLIYMAMEFVEGTTLRHVIQKEGHLDALRAIAIMRQSLHALQEAHDLGIVHRDLKPDNIMLMNFRKVREFVKVLDFGIAKVKENPGQQQAKLTQHGVVYGTPEYLSPEQAQAKELDGRSDIYSMGIILYEMVTGVVPFQSSTAVAVLAAHVYDEPKAPMEVASHEVHPKMDAIIRKAITKDTSKRYQTAMEFLADLEDLEQELVGETATKTTILDASQLSLVLEVSKQAQQRREQADVLAAAKQVKVPGQSASAPKPEPQVIPADPMGPPTTAPLASAAPSPYILITVAALIAIILMLVLALMKANSQNNAAEASGSYTPDVSHERLEQAPYAPPRSFG